MGDPPAIGDLRPFKALSSAEAGEVFVETRDSQQQWASEFVRFCSEGGKSVGRLDYTFDSLNIAWAWFFELADVDEIGNYQDPAVKKVIEGMDNMDRWMRTWWPKVAEYGIDWCWSITFLSGYLTETISRVADTRWELELETDLYFQQPLFWVRGAAVGLPISILASKASHHYSQRTLRQIADSWLVMADFHEVAAEVEALFEVESHDDGLVSVSFPDEVAHEHEQFVERIELALPRQIKGIEIVDGDREVLYVRHSSMESSELVSALEEFLGGLADPRGT